MFSPTLPRPERLECVFISIKKSCVLFVSLYISGTTLPAASYISFLDYIIHSTDEFLLSAPEYKVVICGDFNTVFINTHLNTLCLMLSLCNIVDVPTRDNVCLDLCLVSSEIKDCFLEPIVYPPVATSDHSVIFIPSRHFATGINGVEFKVCDFRKSNIDIFLKTEFDFNQLYSVNDLDVKVTLFHECMYNAFSTIPTRTVVMTGNDKEWLTPRIKLLIHDRWDAYHKRDWPLFNHFKLKVKVAILNAKRIWAETASRSSKDLWNFVNSVSGKKVATSIDSIAGDCSVDFVNALNTRFATNFNPRDINQFVIPDTNVYNNWSPTVTEEWVFDTISKYKSNKATGSDDIPVRLYQEAAHIISLPIAHIINSSFFVKICTKIVETCSYCCYPEKFSCSY